MNKTMQGKRQNDPHYEKIPSTQYIGAYFYNPFLGCATLQ